MLMKALGLAAFIAMGAAEDGMTRQEPQQQEQARRLHELFDAQWQHWMEDSPTWASRLGDRRYNDRWPEVSLESWRRRDRHDREMLQRLSEIDRELLSPADRLNYDLFQQRLADDTEERYHRSYLAPLNQRGGVQNAHELAHSLRFQTVKDYEDWIARLRAVGGYVDQHIEVMREGVRVGWVPPEVIVKRVPDQIAFQLVDEPTQSPWYKPLERIPDDMDEAEAARLRGEAARVIGTIVVPAYRRFQRFFDEEYGPAARPGVGASDLPGGEAFYAFRVRMYTSTDLAYEAIHRKGLEEVARIRAEMEAVMRRVEFDGDFEAFLHLLRTDARFYATDGEALLQTYRAVSKRIDPKLVELFGRLPRMPYGVKPIPDEIAPDTTTAYYSQPAADGSRAGTYWVNLYRPEVRPLYEIMALTIHEAVPGHHLQIALAQELGELPEFRRYGGYTAFVEGWALYAESLGEEMGLYEDPYDKFGQLTYEMWRAVRLVVDTGLHAMGWSRQRAIDFFKANAAKTEHDIVNEIDRYIAWPGQALAYKVGELKIQELRRRAEERLGARFDIRAFHDMLLSQGAVPLGPLERLVEDWLETEGARALSPPPAAAPPPSSSGRRP